MSTIIDRLTGRATKRPAALLIRPRDVNVVTAHILASARKADESSRLFVQNQILLGRVKLLGVPIKVAS